MTLLNKIEVVSKWVALIVGIIVCVWIAVGLVLSLIFKADWMIMSVFASLIVGPISVAYGIERYSFAPIYTD